MDAHTLRSAIAERVFASGHDETSTRATMADLGLEHPDRQAYIPSAWWILRWLLPTSDVHAGDVFVDFGCGKGRVVLDAARRYRFATVIGVDLSADLTAVATRLVGEQARKLRCRDVRIETADVTDYEIPDAMTHAYMFNPFNGPPFERVVENIIASFDRAPRRIRVIYVNPVDHDTVMATGRFRVVRRVATTRVVSRVGVMIYEVKPRD